MSDILNEWDQEAVQAEMDQIIMESTFYSNREDKLFFAVYPDQGRNFFQDPYIKVSNNQKFRDNDVARIHIKDGSYEIHRGMSIDLTNKDLKRINKAMQSKSPDNPDETVWDAMLHELDKLSPDISFEEFKEKYPYREFTLEDLGSLKGARTKRWGGK